MCESLIASDFNSVYPDQVREAVNSKKEEKDIPSVANDSEKKYSRSLSWQSQRDWTKHKLFQRKKPLLCLEFNKTNKQNVDKINIIERSSFSFFHNNCLLRVCSQRRRVTLASGLTLAGGQKMARV